ncbi:hypothetical protein NPA07_04535 [Mycoplasmopsis caviae]|uniref:Uncharacterized protein n=1 Tax=Mycoplasmopsis caviae TaxID=55603 RepID=A0A3P8MDR0_9BACT|nr:hypothetical protein [Mycoplasmopsis caviae]UUD35044.1 hypothetical protein NPA07_04535 [Mycoplasmopsis caviae]VDR42130.1 Uncharacterised protein [Mycoplasmopsis caviae]
MNLLAKFRLLLETEFANGMPQPFGAFHLTFMFTFLILGTFLCATLWNKKEWVVKLTIGLIFLVMVFIEILKHFYWFGTVKETSASVYKYMY